MSKDEMPLHEQQRVIHKASLAAMNVENRFPQLLLQQLDKLSEELFQACENAYAYGEPDQYLLRCQTMTTFSQVTLEMLNQANNKK